MKIRYRAIFAALLLVGLVLLLNGSPPAAEAQDKTVKALSRDTEITINADGTFDVREIYELDFTGSFTYGYRNIAVNQIENITDISVSDGDGNVYTQNRSEKPETFYVDSGSYSYNIKWYYPPAYNETRTFVIDYTVHGGLFIKEEGDQLQWIAVDGDRGYDIEEGRVEINLPESATIDMSVEPYYEGGSSATYEVSDDKSSIVYEFGYLGNGWEFGVGIQFTHGIVPAVVPSWQAEAEAEILARQEEIARRQEWDSTWRPVVNLGTGALSVLTLVGGLLGVYFLYVSKGRDPKTGVVPEYLSEPPSDLPPGIIGTLIDEKADMKDIVATLIDLARRGVFDMQEEEKTVFGITTSKDFVFTKRDDFTGELRDYEKELVREVFGSRKKVTLDDLRNKFYTAIPKLQTKLYKAVVDEGLFPKSPRAVRGKWMVFGVIGLVLSVVVGFCGAIMLIEWAELFFCLPMSVGVVSLGLAIVSQAMPAKTKKGSEEVVKWKAFKTYLRRIESYANLEDVTDQFDAYLPYAVAFGLENTWVHKFSRIETTPMPIWYYPVGVPYNPGRRHMMSGGSMGSGSIGDLSGGGVQAPSLQRMSDGFAGGLQSMSDGLTSMLNTTSSVLRSMPSSSGSSGGGFSSGGFSGGGFSGGGGGSSGFG